MKRILTLCGAFAILGWAVTAKAQSCCVKKASGMQALALNDEFKKLHLLPEPFNYEPGSGSEMITFPTTDGKTGNAFYVPAQTASKKVLLVFHEWWGLNDYIKQEAERWQQLLGNDIAVYAVDMYDGSVATDADQASRLMSELTPAHGAAIIKGLLNKIGKDKEIETLGWCMGGSWSFAAAVLGGTQTKACAMYYGFPEKDIKNIKPLRSDVLYIRATQDQSIPETDVKQFEQNVKATGNKFEIHRYEAVHAFANPSNPKHDTKNTAAAQEVTVTFLKAHFR